MPGLPAPRSLFQFRSKPPRDRDSVKILASLPEIWMTSCSFGVAAVSTLPELGVVVVQLPGSVPEPPDLTLQGGRLMRTLKLVEIAKRLEGDPRVLTASPNSILSPFMLTSAAVVAPGTSDKEINRGGAAGLGND